MADSLLITNSPGVSIAGTVSFEEIPPPVAFFNLYAEFNDQNLVSFVGGCVDVSPNLKFGYPDIIFSPLPLVLQSLADNGEVSVISEPKSDCQTPKAESEVDLFDGANENPIVDATFNAS